MLELQPYNVMKIIQTPDMEIMIGKFKFFITELNDKVIQEYKTKSHVRIRYGFE